jgi:CRISPR-associated protein Csd1
MTILQSLARFYERLEGRGESQGIELVPRFGFKPVEIDFVLEIMPDGQPLSLLRLIPPDERRGPTLMMPGAAYNPRPGKSEPEWEDLSFSGRTSGRRSYTFWDKSSYVFGVTSRKAPGDAGQKVFPDVTSKSREDHLAFVAAHKKLLVGAKDPMLKALLQFVERWEPDGWEKSGFSADALDRNVAFRVKGAPIRIDEVDEARRLATSVVRSRTPPDYCLIEGKLAPFAPKHPQFKGVAGAQSSGAALVSFNADAFRSYGKEQGANAPVSEDAAFRYGAALNWLLDRSNARSFRLGETTVVFWADEKTVGADQKQVGEQSALAAEDEFWKHLGPPPMADVEDVGEALTPEAEDDWSDSDIEYERDADSDNADRIRGEIQKAATARGVPSIDALKPETRLHVLGLSPNSGRIAVRFWLVDTYGHIAENLEHHVEDLTILPRPFAQGMPKPGALVLELVPASIRKDRARVAKLLQSKWMAKLVGEMFFAIISGRAYPQTLLATIVARLRADKFIAGYRKDGSISGARVALCVATINRKIRLRNGPTEEKIPLSLDPENMNAAYRLGRLFALIEGAQKAALPKLNATVKDRFFGSACATPARVFPLLHKNAMNHLAAVRKERGAGLAGWMEKEIGQVWSGLSDDLPRSLRLDDQGRFIAGYYHQRFSKAVDAPAEAQSILASDPEGTEQ